MRQQTQLADPFGDLDSSSDDDDDDESVDLDTADRPSLASRCLRGGRKPKQVSQALFPYPFPLNPVNHNPERRGCLFHRSQR